MIPTNTCLNGVTDNSGDDSTLSGDTNLHILSMVEDDKYDVAATELLEGVLNAFSCFDSNRA
jgi:hypothetical protein